MSFKLNDMRYKFIQIKTIRNSKKGDLSFFESEKNLTFKIKRIYFTYNVPLGVKRGMHAHKNLKQLLWCPYGKIEVILDDGKEKKIVVLDRPEKGLLIENGIWREMIWKKTNSVLCVAASEYYDEDDYIRDYKTFLNYVREGYWKNEN